VDFLKKTTADTAVPQFLKSFFLNRATAILAVLNCATDAGKEKIQNLFFHFPGMPNLNFAKVPLGNTEVFWSKPIGCASDGNLRWTSTPPYQAGLLSGQDGRKGWTSIPPYPFDPSTLRQAQGRQAGKKNPALPCGDFWSRREGQFGIY